MQNYMKSLKRQNKTYLCRREPGKVLRMRAVVDDKIPFLRGRLERLVEQVDYLPGHAISSADLADADILIVRTRTRCDRSLLKGTAVRLVVTATIGYDHLDTDFLETAGIAWGNCPGCNATSVRQYVLASLLVLGKADARHVAGVVGVGHVGSLIAEALRHRGMKVLCCDPLKGEPTQPLSELARCCDIITFHPNLTRTGPYPSYHLADAAFFDSLEKKPLIINTSRGEVVDNAALLQALRNGQVSGAVIDTWEHEPDINLDLLRAVSIGTPHIAGYSADGKVNATNATLTQVARFLGKPWPASEVVSAPSLPPGFCYGHWASEGPLRLYDPRVDCERLRAHPADFEHLRGNYPLRREREQCQ